VWGNVARGFGSDRLLAYLSDGYKRDHVLSFQKTGEYIMGWSLRRSKKVGPFRINLSKSGIGLSAGIKGLRVGRDAKGRTYSSVSIPGTGLNNRTYQSKSVNKSRLSTTERRSVERPRTTVNTIEGFFLLATVIAFVLGHWILGVLFILLTVAAHQPPSQKTGVLPSGSQDRDLRNVGNIPQETLDYLASKKGRWQ
jgi:hypothetical protein